jgi:hydroxysqualene synthase
VASYLVPARHRPIILAFYEFVRTADDIADHESLTPQEKIALLDELERELLEGGDRSPEAAVLRMLLAERRLSTQHAQDLLKAFRLDATKRRYADWSELLDYCSLSAMPVGRFVLDVCGESRTNWPASDAICAALQIINHLQDCAEDYRRVDRVYLPLDTLAAAGSEVGALGRPAASPALRACLADLARKTEALLREGGAMPVLVEDFRLALEISVIYRLALRLTHLLAKRDPLNERVHLSAAEVVGTSVLAIANAVSRRVSRRFRRPASAIRL